VSKEDELNTEQETKPQRKPFFSLADNELLITHDDKPHVHRVVFKSKTGESDIGTVWSVFYKLKSKIQNWKDTNLLNFWKNSSYTFGLNKFGRFVIYVKSDLNVFPKEFLRSLRKDFNLSDFEIRVLIHKLDFVETEIAHKINDPLGKLKDAKVNYNLKNLVSKLIAFTDNSNGSIEFEVKGDPETSGNLEFLLRDKLSAVLYFAELTKIIFKLTEVSNQLNSELEFVRNGVIFLIDHLLNKKLNDKRYKKSW